jgi:hypothetical protein
VVLLLLIGIGICLYFISTSPLETIKDGVTPSEENCQNYGPFLEGCDCNKTLICADAWDHNCRRMTEQIDCHMSKAAATMLNGTVMP